MTEAEYFQSLFTDVFFKAIVINFITSIHYSSSKLQNIFNSDDDMTMYEMISKTGPRPLDGSPHETPLVLEEGEYIEERVITCNTGRR